MPMRGLNTGEAGTRSRVAYDQVARYNAEEAS